MQYNDREEEKVPVKYKYPIKSEMIENPSVSISTRYFAATADGDWCVDKDSTRIIIRNPSIY